MERNHFKERAEVRMEALGLKQRHLAEMLGVPVTRVTEALRGDKAPALACLRVKIEIELNRLIEEKRKDMIEEIRRAVGMEADDKVSLILPEDLEYLVTYGGIPIGKWNPVSKTYKAYEEA